ncbi:MAG: hypothetical protein SVK08_02465 [Halobacteriota archaeon]|nr:hypothetical protein [Halobacteriota archaeon]
MKQYTIILEPIKEENGGGWEAFIPQLGRWTFTGIGENEAGALASLVGAKNDIHSYVFKNGEEPPEPKEYEEVMKDLFCRELQEKMNELIRECEEVNTQNIGRVDCKTISWSLLRDCIKMMEGGIDGEGENDQNRKEE